MSAEERLAELGIELPDPPEPVGSYVEAVQSGNLLFLAGHGPVGLDGQLVRGKVGDALDVDAGYQAARLVGLGLLATIRAELGSLDKVARVVKVFGMVNAPPDFGRHPQVINGVSDLMVEVFGDAGRHARSAVGMGSLPFDIPVEVEMVIEVAE